MKFNPAANHNGGNWFSLFKAEEESNQSINLINLINQIKQLNSRIEEIQFMNEIHSAI